MLDSGEIALPDATGNRRIDTLRNVVATGWGDSCSSSRAAAGP
jgi:predicted pyridoxine 5'-phosphate oxidase superfamily flavin-nucleotide-binding protein